MLRQGSGLGELNVEISKGLKASRRQKKFLGPSRRLVQVLKIPLPCSFSAYQFLFSYSLAQLVPRRLVYNRSTCSPCAPLSPCLPLHGVPILGPPAPLLEDAGTKLDPATLTSLLQPLQCLSCAGLCPLARLNSKIVSALCVNSAA